MKLGIKGHETRGYEIIKILEMLGGKNRHEMKGSIYDKYFYYIDDEYKDISYSYIGPDEIKGYEIFSLDEFLKKFPYKVGDKVTLDNKLCSIIWMCWECNTIYYQVQGEDLMFTKKVMANELKPYNEKNTNMNIESDLANDDEEQQIDTSIDYSAEILKSMNEELEKRRTEFIMETLYTAGITCEFLEKHGFTLPDGYHFTDRNGNTIDTTEIRLVKNPPYYPTTYDECCEMLNTINSGNPCIVLSYLGRPISSLAKLIVIRDAYWKIAGEQMGLGKPWEPDWNESKPKYTIAVIENKLVKHYALTQHCILAFPTEEMRDEFYKNFKYLIELCKELL